MTHHKSSLKLLSPLVLAEEVKLHYEERRRELVNYLRALGAIRSGNVERAFLTVPREEFVPPELRDEAYVDTPLPLFDTGQTISAPHMVAYMVEMLELTGCLKVLEVGGGSGYAACVVAEVINPTGAEVRCPKVYTIEIDPFLVRFARENIRRTGYEERVEVIEGDGTLGLPEMSPFDRIMVSAAAANVPPALLEQLAEGGKMLIPIGRHIWGQKLYSIKKAEGEIKKEFLMEVAFVPLRCHGEPF